MDERAKIPVSLPSENPTQSYWQDPPDPIADLRTTEQLPSTADTVIIGSGITGAAVAWGLLQHSEPGPNPDGLGASIVMLEARQACSGATGRNGGHTKAASYRSFPAHASTLGVPAAAQIAQLELSNILAVHAFAREHGIPCDLEACNTVDIIYDEGDWAHACAAVEAMRAALPPGHPAAEYTLYSAEQARARFHVHDTHFGSKEEKVCGAVEYFAGSLSAYRFCVGVLRMCLDWGMNLQTGTPVVELSRDVTATASTTDVVGGDGGDGVGAMWTVHTPRGAIRARRVVLATNGYTARIVPRFQGVLVPLRGQITAQRPGTAMPNGGCLPTTYSFCYKKGYEYMITRPQGSRFAGDVIIGGGLAREPDEGLLEFGTTDDTAVNERISRYLREATPRYFGSDWGDDDPAGRVRSEWTGIMGFSPDGFPFVGEVPGEKGLWASCGFQGHGMVLCWMCARALVEMVEGRDNEQLRDWFPDTYRITETRLAKKFEGRLH